MLGYFDEDGAVFEHDNAETMQSQASILTFAMEMPQYTVVHILHIPYMLKFSLC